MYRLLGFKALGFGFGAARVEGLRNTVRGKLLGFRVAFLLEGLRLESGLSNTTAINKI